MRAISFFIAIFAAIKMKNKMPDIKNIRILLHMFCILPFITYMQAANTNELHVYQIDIRQDINSTTWIYTQRGFELAQKSDADCVLINMNTYGGEVKYADSIRTKILNAGLPVYVFIDNNAASAGALISIACDKIYMRPGATIGATTVVNQTGEAMPDKYQSYMRATMRATAEAQGKDTIVNGKDTTYRWRRDPLIAEAMVDSRTVVPGLIDSTRTLTFTAEEAAKYGYCDGIVENTDELIQHCLGHSEYTLQQYKPTGYDKIKGFLNSSILQSLLIMLIIGAIYFELQTPGVGFPLAVAVLAALLYFAPLYMDGLAAYWEILLFFIGLLLIGIEIFVIPGFGITGITGIILVILGLTLSLIDNVAFDFRQVETGGIGKALLTVMSGLVLGVVLIVYLCSKIGSHGLFRRIALETSMDKQDGYMSVPEADKNIVGQKGQAVTILRPAGKIKIGSTYYDAMSEGAFIEAGTPVVVTRYEMGQMYVKPC